MSGDTSKKYKLTYFNARGIAEVSRLIMAAAGVEYEDFRFQRDDWPSIKPTTPMGKAPTFEIRGKGTLCESGAINRYLAREYGLTGSDNFDEARVDMIASSFFDLAPSIGGFMREADEAKKAELKKKFFSETLPDFLTRMEKLLKANNDGKGFMVGDKLTYGDIVSYHICSQLTRPVMEPTCLDAFPVLKDHRDRIGEIPRIKNWVQNRPVTEM